MSSSNPLEPIYRAYVVSSDCFKVVQRTVGRQQAALVQRTQFHGASEEDAKTAIIEAAKQASDLAILALFATFERFVIEHLQAAHRLLGDGHPTEYSSRLAKKFEDEVEYWRFDEVLELFKGEIDPVLIGNAKQIKDYRDWIAHRNTRRPRPSAPEPRTAFEILTAIVEQIRIKHAPPAPPMDAQAAPVDEH
jgi:hypothetical protein